MAMLKRLIIPSLVLICCSGLVADVQAATNDKAQPTADPTQVRQWIKQLANDDYAIRESASVELVKRGPTVLDAIREHAAVDDAEQLWRTVHIVQQIAMSGDIDLLDRSIGILEHFRKSAPAGGNAILGTSADDLRNRFRLHAQRQITQLGGVISPSHLGGGLGVDLGQNFKGTDKHLRYLKVLGSITYIRLTGEKFKDTSLDHFKGMSDLQQLHLMETAVTSKGQKVIENQIEGIKVLRFGPAVIGISGVTHSDHCLVQAVQPGTGADRGGLRAGDMVTKLDGTEIKSFEDLVGIVAEKKVDQVVKVEVLRGGKESNHLVTLTRRPATNRQVIQHSFPPGFVPGRIELIPRR
jgi:hypothetical protein